MGIVTANNAERLGGLRLRRVPRAEPHRDTRSGKPTRQTSTFLPRTADQRDGLHRTL